MALSTFTLCSHHHHPSLQCFHLPNWNSLPTKLYVPISLSSSPSATTMLLSISTNLTLLYIPHISGTRQHLSFCDWLTSLNIISSWFLHVVATCQTFLPFKPEWHSMVWIHHTLFIHSAVAGQPWLRLPFGYCEWYCYENGCTNVSPRHWF